MPKLVGIQGSLEGQALAIGEAGIKIGGGADNGIQLSDPGVSRHHARITADNGDWVLTDLGSRNGVLVNGKKRHVAQLADGDVIRVGTAQFRFAMDGDGAGPGAPKATDDAEPASKPAPEPGAASAPSRGRRERHAGPVVARDAAGGVDLAQTLARVAEARRAILAQVQRIIVGQDQVIEELLICLFSRGHALIVGVPGLAKTLMVRTLSGILDLNFKRIQFTPDLMPSDITGTDILEEDPATKQRNFKFIKGPIFANILLADEINRTPPKTQAALLEAMQESRVTAAGRAFELDPPFFVLATQNPIEQEGTYPLPEAQLDRFMFNILIRYPSRTEEIAIVQRTTGDDELRPSKVLGTKEILALATLVRQVPVSDHVVAYAADLVRSSRPGEPDAPAWVTEWLTWGAGPRATQYLVIGAKARALLRGKTNVSCSDVRAVAPPVLRHRLFPNFNATSEGVDAEKIVERLLEEVPEPSPSS